MTHALGWEDPLEKRTATYSSILPWRIPWTEESMGVTRSWTQLSDFHFTSLQNPIVKVEIEAWREVGVGSLQMYVDSSLHLGGIVLINLGAHGRLVIRN